MKALFLDIDGVINTFDKETDERICFKPEKLVLIDDVIKECHEDVVLVISSTWRLHQPVESFEFWIRRLGCWHWKEISMTPRLPGKLRGSEVAKWLNSRTDITGYVIIDDDSDFFGNQKKYLVRTDTWKGFTEKDRDLAIKIINGSVL